MKGRVDERRKGGGKEKGRKEVRSGGMPIRSGTRKEGRKESREAFHQAN